MYAYVSLIRLALLSLASIEIKGDIYIYIYTHICMHISYTYYTLSPAHPASFAPLPPSP